MKYDVTFSPAMDELLSQLCQELNCPPAQVVQKALKLLSYVSAARKAKIVLNGEEKEILI